jgi:branched-chain amino acid transport system ATP-binding protein
MLKIAQLHAFYGKSHVLNGISMQVGVGEIVALLGRNGSGRSTTAKAIMGLVEAHGSVLWRGRQLLGKKTYEIAQAGLGYVPESRDIFPTLTVEQNLMLGQKPGQMTGRWSMGDLYAMFPQLKARQHAAAGVLSGGEQQMLTLCRCLMGNPDLIIVDEPTEGLAPQVVALLGQFLVQLKAREMSVLLIEQKLTLALDVSDRCYVMGHGRVVFEGSPQALRQADAVRREWLEV